jgi:hypothetical protein
MQSIIQSGGDAMLVSVAVGCETDKLKLTKFLFTPAKFLENTVGYPHAGQVRRYKQV